MSDFSRSGVRRPRRRGLLLRSGVLLVVSAIQVALFMSLSRAGPVASPMDPPPIVVTLVKPPPPSMPEPIPEKTSAPAQAAPAATALQIAPPSSPPPPARPPRQPPPPHVETVAMAPSPPALPVLTASQTAVRAPAGPGAGGGSGGAGSGSGAGGAGGGCDMVRRLQDALRNSASVRAAVETADRRLNASGRAIQVWDGDWLRSDNEAGKGLAGVRQAIALEVAFAPADCRAEPMRGLVVLSLGDAPRASRIALGTSAWRWSDLLEID